MIPLKSLKSWELRCWGRHLWAAALALCVVACAGTPKLPSQGGTWLEVKTENITLWTNAGAHAARELVQRMELQRLVVLGLMRVQTRTRPIFAVAFRRASQLRSMADTSGLAFAWDERNPILMPVVVLSLENDEDYVINHELTHAVSHSIVRNQPRWLAEGMATYFESAVPDATTRVAQAGLPNEGLRRHMSGRSRLPTTRTLFACNSIECTDPDFYAASWLLFSYLINREHARLGRYLAMLDADADPSDAWRTVFSDLTPEALDLAIGRNLGSFALPEVRVEPKHVAMQGRNLEDADLLATRALLGGMFGRGEPLREALEVLDRSPTHLLAALIASSNGHKLSTAHAREIARAHPADARAWLLLLSSSTEPSDRALATEKLCALGLPTRQLRCQKGERPARN